MTSRLPPLLGLLSALLLAGCPEPFFPFAPGDAFDVGVDGGFPPGLPVGGLVADERAPACGSSQLATAVLSGELVLASDGLASGTAELGVRSCTDARQEYRVAGATAVADADGASLDLGTVGTAWFEAGPFSTASLIRLELSPGAPVSVRRRIDLCRNPSTARLTLIVERSNPGTRPRAVTAVVPLRCQ